MVEQHTIVRKVRARSIEAFSYFGFLARLSSPLTD